MKSFRKHTGLVAPLDQPNIDTDQIIPKQFLKRTKRTGFGRFLFNDWRYLSIGLTFRRDAEISFYEARRLRWPAGRST